MTVHGDTGLGEPLHDVQGFPGSGVAQHLHPQGRVGGVDGDVDGGDAQVDNALDLAGGEVREGQIVAHQKGQPGVIILKIEGFPHTRRELVHKAEHAPVGAGAGLVHQIGFKVQAQILALGLPDPDGPAGAVGAGEGEDQAGVVGVEFVVQHVQYGLAVDVGEGLAGVDARPVGGTVQVHMADGGHGQGGHLPFCSHFTMGIRLLQGLLRGDFPPHPSPPAAVPPSPARGEGLSVRSFVILEIEPPSMI